MIRKIHEEFITNSLKIFREDLRILGVAIGGSYITNDMDEYSDVDLIIAIDNKYFKDIIDDRFKIAAKLGTLLSSFTGEHIGELGLIICLYGPDLLQVDLKFITLDDLTCRVENPTILWERNNCISNTFKLSEAKFPLPDLQWIEDRFWIWIYYISRKIGRGEIFETIESISFLRQTVIGPLLLMKNGKLPRGVRKLETDAVDNLPLLIETVPTYNSESCIKSLKIIIKIYLDLREYFLTDKFIKRTEAEKSSLEYLDNLIIKLKLSDKF
ncbi:nucleotidyltransferase domain-containing protein [Clostridioides sp. ZZV15-6598]|uniref:nucleotidyltransferase domain-containing protein n=1 Tax=Clostridioides sp. ZZV15-6598 TaxID=2811501 RepID=UPI001D1258DE|nr:nucleotidyltransferase domain-containing protein [Clostridioides sp. ZZV15-6598]